MQLRINWQFPRCVHMRERMHLRVISQYEVGEAIRCGQKRKQRTHIWEVRHRDYSIVYEERLWQHQNIRKVYPITVKLW